MTRNIRLITKNKGYRNNKMRYNNYLGVRGRKITQIPKYRTVNNNKATRK